MVTTGYHLKARDAYARDKPMEFKGPSTDAKLIHSMLSCLRPNFHNKLKACSSQKKNAHASVSLCSWLGRGRGREVMLRTSYIVAHHTYRLTTS